jgi:hypothetical protein
MANATKNKSVKPSWQVESWEEVCERKGWHPIEILPIVSHCPEHLRKQTIATFKLMAINEVINEGWVPKKGELRYWPRFYTAGPGFRFVVFGFVRDYSFATFGSRLCYFDYDRMRYGVETFLPIWEDLIEV